MNVGTLERRKKKGGEENHENDSMKIGEFTFIMRHKSISIHSVFSYRYVSSFTSYAGMKEGRRYVLMIPLAMSIQQPHL